MEYIQRKEYLDFLIRHKDRPIIKVVSGIRRSGKSTLFEIYKDYLLQSGIDEKQIISINFEDLEYEEYKDYKKLYTYIKSQIVNKQRYYIFLDEIQHVVEFEKAVDSLFIQSNLDLYITGSNAYFMSSELATLLTGRYVELAILPLSFKEFYDVVKTSELSKMEVYRMYLRQSSFPYALFLQDDASVLEYLQGIYHSILLKDIVARYRIQDVMLLERIIRYVFDNIGNLISIKKIADTLTSMGRKTESKTIEKYLQALLESLLIYQAKRYDVKGKELLATNGKYYVADVGLRQLLLAKSDQDQGHILENIVYLELIRRGYEVYVGYIRDGEIDFVAKNREGISYYQVCATVLDPSTLRRELAPLEKVKDQYPKYLLTFDEIGANESHNGIVQYQVLDWLLDK